MGGAFDMPTLVIANATQARFHVLDDIAVLLRRDPSWITRFHNATFQFVCEQPGTDQQYSADRIHGDSIMSVTMNERDGILHHAQPLFGNHYRFYTSILPGS
jgi:hypothetical protein